MKSLERCRVLDLGIITAGAATSAVLADLGAEVIKIESATYKDPFREWTGELLPGDLPDLPIYFRMTNRGKLNAGIDLKNQQGREVFLRLVERSDVVVENFRRGVLARLGLDYGALQAANPDIILASISSQGEDGPDANYISFGSTLEAMAGLAATTGYAEGPPIVSGIGFNYPDQVVAIFAAGMIATAWYARESGGGVHLDLSQRELTSFMSGEAFLAPRGRVGNAQPGIPIQECFLSRDGRWIAVTVEQRNLAWLREVAGGATPQHLAKWIEERSEAEALAGLQSAGIAAAAARDGRGVLSQHERKWARALQRDANGDPVKGVLFDDGAPPKAIDRPAAQLGADTREVLARVGGYSEQEIEALIEAGAVNVGRAERELTA